MSFPNSAQNGQARRAGGLVGVGSHARCRGLLSLELWMLASGGMTPLEVLRCAP